MTHRMCLLRHQVISSRTSLLRTLYPSILVPSEPSWTPSSIWNTSSSAKSSIWRDHFSEQFLKCFYQNIFQKRVQLEICRTTYEFPSDSIICGIPVQNTDLTTFGLLHFSKVRLPPCSWSLQGRFIRLYNNGQLPHFVNHDWPPKFRFGLR